LSVYIYVSSNEEHRDLDQGRQHCPPAVGSRGVSNWRKVTQRVSTTTLDPPTLAHVISGREGEQLVTSDASTSFIHAHAIIVKSYSHHETWR
jgi:hypothetical protein